MREKDIAEFFTVASRRKLIRYSAINFEQLNKKKLANNTEIRLKKSGIKSNELK